ncbi:hypothetical protein NPIL_99971 [Nephila pilipes]|uniref:Uncharacterized protein n=1 Tax=Nephila pilipes TaxID=299642 RepID=A0A8X6NPH0_NEPPI|nr:hypothetical protein NPIL_99971 [Nephila pilipes]
MQHATVKTSRNSDPSFDERTQTRESRYCALGQQREITYSKSHTISDSLLQIGEIGLPNLQPRSGPLNFRLFPSLKAVLSGSHFQNNAGVEARRNCFVYGPRIGIPLCRGSRANNIRTSIMDSNMPDSL